MNFAVRVDRPASFIRSLPDALIASSMPEHTQAPDLSPESHYDSTFQRLLFSGNPGYCAGLFGFINGLMAALQPYCWGFYGSHKVAVTVGGAVGGLLGSACGLLKGCGLGTSDEISQPLRKTIHDYAVRGADIGTLGSYLVAWLPAAWLGLKVTIAAASVLTVSVPVIATLGALSGIEFAYRGNKSIGYRVIDTVLEYTLPFRYFTTPMTDAARAYRQLTESRNSSAASPMFHHA